MMKKKIIGVITLAIFLICLLLLAKSLNNDATLLPSNLLNKPVPAFSKATIEDAAKIITQKDIKGPALVNVWATWCPTCRSEHTMLNKLKREGVVIYGINYKDEANAARKWLSDLGNPYQFNINDQNGQLGIDLGVYGAPETFFINAEGKIIHRHVGDLNQQNWNEQLQAIYKSL